MSDLNAMYNEAEKLKDEGKNDEAIAHLQQLLETELDLDVEAEAKAQIRRKLEEELDRPLEEGEDIGDAIKDRLEEEANELNTVTISAGAFEASDEKKAVILNSLDIVTTAGANADIATALNTLPGHIDPPHGSSSWRIRSS